ncbi:MAG: TlpA disulfide reductase family protein [Saprospiraceae bacterium]
MKWSVCFFLHFGIITHAYAQSLPQSVVIEANEHINSIKQGWFDCTIKWKSFSKTDTSIYSGRIYFFQPQTPTDSVKRFILKQEEGFWRAYDGEKYYTIDPKMKRISALYVAAVGKPFRRMVNQHRDGMLLFFPFLFNSKIRPPLFPDRMRNATIDTVILHSGEKAIFLSICDSIADDEHLTSSASGYIKYFINIKYDLPSLNLINYSMLVPAFGMFERPQYEESLLSPIYQLPDTVTFEHVLNLDSLLNAGFTISDQKNAPIRKSPSILGDTIPALTLYDYNNKPVALDRLPGKLVLFDFWYQGCVPCVASIPAMVNLYKKYSPKGLEIFGINSHDFDANKVKSFAISHGIPYTSLIDRNMQLTRHLTITAYPTFIIADPVSRKILYEAKGYNAEFTEEELSAAIEKYLNQ